MILRHIFTHPLPEALDGVEIGAVPRQGQDGEPLGGRGFLARTAPYHPMFDKIAKPQKKRLVFCSGKDAQATGEFTEDGLVVFAGSRCNLHEVKSAKHHVREARRRLKEDGVLQANGTVFEFAADHIFASPSRAAAVVLGREANGWIEWKYEDGRTLDEVHRQASSVLDA